jgi:hypothetical protein
MRLLGAVRVGTFTLMAILSTPTSTCAASLNLAGYLTDSTTLVPSSLDLSPSERRINGFQIPNDGLTEAGAVTRQSLKKRQDPPSESPDAIRERNILMELETHRASTHATLRSILEDSRFHIERLGKQVDRAGEDPTKLEDPGFNQIVSNSVAGAQDMLTQIQEVKDSHAKFVAGLAARASRLIDWDAVDRKYEFSEALHMLVSRHLP